MALTRDQSLNLYGTEAYTAWGEAEAAADAAAKGLTGGGGGGADSFLNNAINSFTSLVKKVTPYEQVSPFAFDEALARRASEAEYAPYYKELLTDYTSNVERQKSRSQEDLNTTLQQLSQGKEYYTGATRRALDKALTNTNEGYAGRGLFFSGARKKDIEDIKTETDAQMGNYLSNYNYNVGQAEKTGTRTAEDLATNLSQYNRDIGREQKFAVESGVLQRRGEALNEYDIKKRDYYANEYGTYA